MGTSAVPNPRELASGKDLIDQTRWVSGVRFGVQGLRLRVPGFGVRVQKFESRVKGVVSGFGFRNSGFRFRVCPCKPPGLGL